MEIIINGSKAQLEWAKWFLEYIDDYEDEKALKSFEDAYGIYTDEEILQLAIEFFEEYCYTVEKIENRTIYVFCEWDD